MQCETHSIRAIVLSGALLVVLALGVDRRPRHPSVVQPLSAASLTYAAFESVRAFRFVPAKRGGEPVETMYTLTINSEP